MSTSVMAVRIIERICKILRRRRQRSTHKPLTVDVSFYVDAGIYFMERTEALCYKNNTSTLRSARNAKKPYSTKSLTRKGGKTDTLERVGSRLRRDAIFELCEEEREGLTIVLKGYIQQRNLKEFGML